jgi:hypothetical protein
MLLDETLKKVSNLFDSIPQKEVTVEGELLSLHESVDNLWAMYREKKDNEDVERKMANVFIGVFLIARKMQINNLDKIVEKRIDEIKNAPYRGK